ncbi:hypothetical protein DV737_g4342, partial [Chaetothyriales sp. CBS 132003]
MNRGARPAGAAAGRQPQKDQYGQPQPQDDQYGQNRLQAQDDQYDQNQSQAQDGQYGQNQPQGDYDQQDGNYGQYGQDDPNDPTAQHQQGDDQGIDEQVNQQQDEFQQERGGKENHDSGYDDPSKKAKGSKAIIKKGTGQLGKKGQYASKPEHAHSRFSQDPHHHNMMGSFHKIAHEGLTPAHIESFVHIGTFALAHLAKQSGMTAGHEPSDDEDHE